MTAVQQISSLAMPTPADGEHRMGTTIMAVKFEDGVILAADSRTSTGTYVANRVSDKLTEISDKIYCCRSGSAADTQCIASMTKGHLYYHSIVEGEEPKVKDAAYIFKNICYDYRGDLSAGIIVGGYDDVKGGQIFSIALGGFINEQPIAVGGSGSIYIMGYLDSNYREGMSEADCKELCTNAVALAMARDGSSGGVIRLAVITKTGVTRHCITQPDIPRFNESV